MPRAAPRIGDLDREGSAFGLYAPLGVYSGTGIGGITLGGGLGWMRRMAGMSCDNLLSADVVTADGQLVTASADHHPDLFWALRGGGWDMGVVTSFEYRAQRVDPEVFFLFVTYPIEDADRVLEAFDAYMRTAPDEANVLSVIWTFPDHGDAYPAEVHGKPFVALVGPYMGTATEGEQAYQPLRELGTPLLDGSGPTPFVTVQHAFDGEYPVGRRYYWKSVYLSALPPEAIGTLTSLARRRPSQLSSIDVWPLGGALARVPVDATPISQRNATHLIGIEANWETSGRGRCEPELGARGGRSHGALVDRSVLPQLRGPRGGPGDPGDVRSQPRSAGRHQASLRSGRPVPLAPRPGRVIRLPSRPTARRGPRTTRLAGMLRRQQGGHRGA